jgi:hypothetical protein
LETRNQRKATDLPSTAEDWAELLAKSLDAVLRTRPRQELWIDEGVSSIHLGQKALEYYNEWRKRQ